jgi:hypothetical protein
MHRGIGLFSAPINAAQRHQPKALYQNTPDTGIWSLLTKYIVV